MQLTVPWQKSRVRASCKCIFFKGALRATFFLHLPFSLVLLIYICAVRQFSASKSASSPSYKPLVANLTNNN